MKYKRLEVVSIDDSIYGQDAAYDINCTACCNGFTYAKNDDELLTYRRFFESEINSCVKSIKDGLKLEITDVDESDVIRWRTNRLILSGGFLLAVFFWPFSFTYCISGQNNTAAIFYPNIPYNRKSCAFDLPPDGGFILSVANVKL